MPVASSDAHPLSGHNRRGRSFEELEDRLGFIRKVYGILFVQLLITVTICAIPVFYEPFKLWMQANIWSLFVSMGVMIVSLCVIMCS